MGDILAPAVFEIIPAVDIQRGRAVRLYEGDPDRETVYFEDPAAAASHWAGLGAATLHLVDLDAALGRGNNSEIVRGIAGSVDSKVELGGGIRDEDSALRWLEVVDRVILGTAAQREPQLVSRLLEQVDPARLAVSIDARGGRVAVSGWARTTDTDAVELAREMAARGLRYLIYTDVSRDGTLGGVDASPLRELRDAFPHTLVAGGGVAGDPDLNTLEQIGLDGAIVGTALYEGRISYPRTA